MSRGHGTIINETSYMPFIFQYNPQSLDDEKKINYVTLPNIGGSAKSSFFSGFDSKEISFKIVCQDFQDPTGVMSEIAYFEQLREPDPGLLGIAASFFGNENYPPPRVYFNWGVSFMTLLWDVIEVRISKTHFHDGKIRGKIGIPKRCEINIKLRLIENHPLNKANKIAMKAQYIGGSIESVTKEIIHGVTGNRKEHVGIFPPMRPYNKW